MKLKDVSALLRAGRTIIIQKGKDCQWIGDGFSAYPMYGLPYMEEQNLRPLLDIPENKWDSYRINSMPLPFTEDDNTPQEFALSDMGVDINYKGTVLTLLIGNRKLFFVQPKYLKPLQDVSDRSYFARKLENDTYVIAVKEGFILRAVIMPYNNIVDEMFIDTMKTIYSLSADILIANKDEKSRRDELDRFMELTGSEEA
ncbi:MAG: hypothetical protein IJ010_08430 [Ruminococcus sp.]|nr:hypothetical protein [Ruminococcus sp.]